MQKGDRVYNWSIHEYAEVLVANPNDISIQVRYDNDGHIYTANKSFFHAVEDHQK